MSQMQRIIVHWTAGGGRASNVDKKHYHRLVEYDGNIVAGTEKIADNIVTADGDYAAHTLNLNTGSIGVAVCGMAGAVESPFDPGASPITEKAWRTLCILVADLCQQYSIPITPRTVLTHAEVQPTLGVRQKGKWDISRLPHRPDLRGAIPIGNHMREMVREAMGQKTPLEGYPTLRLGMRGRIVGELQSLLAHLGYHSGRIDEIYGKVTRGSVLAFQGDNGLLTDGIAGAETWAALQTAKKRPLRTVSEEDLRERGSKTIKAADQGEKLAKAGGGGVAVLETLDVANSAAEKVTASQSALENLQGILIDNWAAIAVIAVGVVIFWQGPAIMAAIRERRVHDAVTGKHLGR